MCFHHAAARALARAAPARGRVLGTRGARVLSIDLLRSMQQARPRRQRRAANGKGHAVSTPTYSVLVAVDFSTAAQGALARALRLADGHPIAEVHVVAVIEGEARLHRSDVPPDALTRLNELANQALADLRRGGAEPHIKRVVTHVAAGSPAREIVWLAAHLDVDLVVVGTHGRTGASRVVLGSVAEHVVRHAGCPVLVERPKHHDVAAKEPAIEPLCEDCRARRVASGGAELWCERHGQHHPHAHVYAWSGPPTGAARPWGFSG